MSQKGTHQNRPITLDQFSQDMRAFVAYMNSSVEPDKVTGRAMFPGFRVKPEIEQKRLDAIALVRGSRLGEAFKKLDEAKEHFQNCQARYAINRTGDLIQYMDGIIQICEKNRWHDLVSVCRRDVHAFVDCVSQEPIKQYFDLDQASKLYWAAIDTLERVESEIATRKYNRAVNPSKKVQRTVAQEQADAQARELEKQQRFAEECAAVAAQLELLEVA